jgi:hypothetical protein
MSTPDRDEEFEAFLARRSLLPRALAEHEDAEPPPEVDRSVLYEAQAAVNAAPARKSFRNNRWPVPVALAATVLISLAIVIQVQRPSSETPMAARVQERTSTQSDIADEPEPDVGALSDSPERFAKASAPAESRALIASANELRRLEEERADEAAEDASTGVSAQSRREAYAAAPPPSAADADASADGAPPAPAPVLADAARARDIAAAESDGGASDSVAAARDRSAADSAGATGARGASDAVAAIEAENGKAAAPAAAASAERDPKAWLERIAKLRAEGRHAQADREFKAFVKRYPDYVTDEAAKSK